MSIVSQLLVKQEGDKKIRTPMVYKCPNGHTEYKDYDKPVTKT